MSFSWPLSFELHETTGTRSLALQVRRLIIAGWTGRDQAALEAHIRELEAIGVARPKTTPIFYRVSGQQLTTATAVQVTGPHSSGEVEPVYVMTEQGLCVGVGSDHTDRKAEAVEVTLSKQACAKPIAPVLWRHADVAGHWDRLTLQSFAVIGGKREPYQHGPITAMRPPEDLIDRYGGIDPGTVMFGGTLAVHGGVRPAERFEIELHDPVLNRTISHGYDIEILPVEG